MHLISMQPNVYADAADKNEKGVGKEREAASIGAMAQPSMPSNPPISIQYKQRFETTITEDG
jgi:hypothetical protein